MFRNIAGITLLLLVILLFVREATEVKPGEIVGDGRLEVRPGGMVWYAIKQSDLASDNESVEIQLDIKHVSGGKAQVLIVDKENFKNALESPCWEIPINAITDVVCIPEYEAISPKVSFADFQGTETTDWINVGQHTHLYLLVTNINNSEVLHINLEAFYRQVIMNNDTS